METSTSPQSMDMAALLSALMGRGVFEFAGRIIVVGELLVAIGLVFLVLRIAFAMLKWRQSKKRAAIEAVQLERTREAEARMAELVASQNALTGRMQTMSEIFTSRQSDMMRLVNDRLESMGGRLGESMVQTNKSTQESLTKLAERLAVIDKAQSNITELSGQVVELQHILANKQTRGAFGEGRMQTIITDGLPKGSYEFQANLSNGKRPDCLIFMPNDTPPLVVDAKFPLEAWNGIRKGDDPQLVRKAQTQFRQDVETHIKAIAQKYLIPGETQDTAFMFVPSESLFAEIHENFEALVQLALRSRIVIVSPSLLMLSIQVIQSILKDVRMREQAHLIQAEIIKLMADVTRLDERVRKLDNHFRQSQKDIGDILISTDKLTKRGHKISDLDFEQPNPAETGVSANSSPKLKAVD